MLPAFSYGCDKAAESPGPIAETPVTKVSLTVSSTDIGTLDIFVFNDDLKQSLDCYQRFDDMDKWTGSVLSSSVKRIITVLANSPYGKENWFPMGSRFFLKKVSFSLEDEDRERPILSGELHTDTGAGIKKLPLSPLTAEVRLNSISCDFSGKAYEGEKISDVKVYLTNVNAECRISDEYGSSPIRIINAGGLNEGDMENFTDPGMVMAEIPQEIGESTLYPSICFMCYQSNHPEETPGTPYTRLVIEGKISGCTYWWPININRDTEEGAGIWRGRSYSYDIRITGKGSSDPDKPIESNDITINQEVRKWEEKEEYGVRF